MEEVPFVSVVMPVRNEEHFIARSLAAVLSQDYPSDRMAVIVADGMSDDQTRAIAMSFVSQHPCLRLIDNPGRIVSYGLNAALRIARGDIIVRVDGHCEIAHDYVSRCVEHLKRNDVDCVGGPIETIGENHLAQVIAMAMATPFGVGGSAFRTVRDKSLFVDTVAFPACKARVIRRAGFFDEELVRNQDDEYSYRLRKLGGRILLAPDVRSRYYSRGSLRSLWRQYFQYGYWKIRVMQKHPRQMSLRQFVPPIFVLVTLLTLLLSAVSAISMWLFLGVLTAYILANLAASIFTGTNLRSLVVLPVVFATLHFSYGSGFLWGLVKFWNRWSDNNKSLVQTVVSDGESR